MTALPLRQAGPFIGGLGYVVAILVQRKFPRFFAIAYFGACVYYRLFE